MLSDDVSNQLVSEFRRRCKPYIRGANKAVELIRSRTRTRFGSIPYEQVFRRAMKRRWYAE